MAIQDWSLSHSIELQSHTSRSNFSRAPNQYYLAQTEQLRTTPQDIPSPETSSVRENGIDVDPEQCSPPWWVPDTEPSSGSEANPIMQPTALDDTTDEECILPPYDLERPMTLREICNYNHLEQVSTNGNLLNVTEDTRDEFPIDWDQIWDTLDISYDIEISITGITRAENERQISIHTEVQYTNEESCVICLQVYTYAFPAVKLPCTHMFHHDCAIRWLVINPSCPVCRFVF